MQGVRQVKQERVPVVQVIYLLAASPLIGGKASDAWAIFNLNKADCRAFPVTLPVKIFGLPAIFSAIIDHFYLEDLGTQEFNNEFPPCVVGSN